MRDSVKYTIVGLASLVFGVSLWAWKIDGEVRYPETSLLFIGVGIVAICLAVAEAFNNSEDNQKDMP